MFFCVGQASSVSGVECLTNVLPTESIQNWIRVNLYMDHPIDQESRGFVFLLDKLMDIFAFFPTSKSTVHKLHIHVLCHIIYTKQTL